MAINFPSNPALNDTYSEGQRTWKFNGTAWNLDTSLLPVGPTGPTGPAGEAVGLTPTFESISVTGPSGSIFISGADLTITGLLDPVLDSDVATKGYVDLAVSSVDLAGSTTDDLAEGDVNLYFADALAVSAVEAAAGLTLSGGITVSGDIVPDTNIAYDLGTSTNRFRDLYLSGNTINLGGATVKSDPTTGTVVIVGAPTAETPNPSALVVTSSGATFALATTGGEVNATAVANAVNTTTAFSGSYNDLTDKPTIPSLTGYATETFVNTAVANLVDSAPGALDTLNELAAALGDHANFSTTITNSIAAKQDSLVSGTNIKTINSTTLLGSGNISVQDTLVSGTNIKTINGTSILGSGDVTIAAGADLSTSSINELQDVTITSPTNGQVLKYNGTAWVNGTDSTGSGGGGDLTAVASDITPDTTAAYDIGSASLKWRNGNFSNQITVNGASLGGAAGSLFTTSSLLVDELFITEDMIVPSAATVVDYYGTAGIMAVDGSLNVLGDWIKIPVGTTDTRPIEGLAGMIRYNETAGRFEGYGTAWAGLGGLEQDADGNNLVNGNLVVTGDVISYSDIALKENVTPIDSALEIVERLSGYFYNLKGQSTRRVGLIAQNVEQALPEAVINSDGNKAVAYGNIVGVLIESIKELKAEISSLKSRLGE